MSSPFAFTPWTLPPIGFTTVFWSLKWILCVYRLEILFWLNNLIKESPGKQFELLHLSMFSDARSTMDCRSRRLKRILSTASGLVMAAKISKIFWPSILSDFIDALLEGRFHPISEGIFLFFPASFASPVDLWATPWTAPNYPLFRSDSCSRKNPKCDITKKFMMFMNGRGFGKGFCVEMAFGGCV